MYLESMYKLGAQPSPIRELFNYGQQQAQLVGRDNVYDFTLGAPSAPPPEEVTEAYLRLIREENPSALHTYTISPGRRETREAVAEDLNQRFSAGIRAEHIYMTCGAAAAIVASIKALSVSHKTEIIAMAPFFPEYRNWVESKGSKLVVTPAAPDFRLNISALDAAITENTQAIIINSPNNPSGKIYTREELGELAQLLTRRSADVGHVIYLISDEPYRELAYDGMEVPFLPLIYPNTIVCYSWSKSFALPGERIGYVLVPPQAEDSRELFLAISGAARSLGYVCAPAMTQRVIEACAGIRPELATYEENRQKLYQGLRQIGYEAVYPNGAFYLFVKAPNGDGQVFSNLAKEKNVLIPAGAGFGCPSYVRISYCVPTARIEKSLEIFRDLYQEAATLMG